MVSLSGVRSHHDENPDDQEEIEDDGPPRVGREAITSLDLGDNRGNECDNPCKLDSRQHVTPIDILGFRREPGACAYC